MPSLFRVACYWPPNPDLGLDERLEECEMPGESEDALTAILNRQGAEVLVCEFVDFIDE